jgi:serine/threonine-protein kinase
MQPVAAYGPGSVIGSYRLIALIGEGSIGRVFVAEHTKLGRKVALKMLRAEATASPRALSRFFGEARAVNEIRHENIVEITDFVEGGDHPSYLIMELLEGETLEQRIAQRGPLPVEDILAIARQLASALGVAHAKEIVHRDLKPANVFLLQRGGRPFVKLLDFGVAKLSSATGGALHEPTAVGSLVGTPEYMSPEQTYGLPADHRSDIYALGLLLCEMATGNRAFAAPNIRDVLTLHQTAPVIPPSMSASCVDGLPAAFDELVLDCLQKRAADRVQSMVEVSERIGAMNPRSKADSSATTVRLPAPLRIEVMPRRPVFTIALSAGIALAVAAGAAVIGSSRRTERQPEGPVLIAPAIAPREAETALEPALIEDVVEQVVEEDVEELVPEPALVPIVRDGRAREPEAPRRAARRVARRRTTPAPSPAHPPAEDGPVPRAAAPSPPAAASGPIAPAETRNPFLQ